MMVGGVYTGLRAFARNPGLGKRNTYSVAAACGSLSLTLPKGRNVNLVSYAWLLVK